MQPTKRKKVIRLGQVGDFPKRLQHTLVKIILGAVLGNIHMETEGSVKDAMEWGLRLLFGGCTGKLVFNNKLYKKAWLIQN